jgi:hypothetical protein
LPSQPAHVFASISHSALQTPPHSGHLLNARLLCQQIERRDSCVLANRACLNFMMPQGVRLQLFFLLRDMCKIEVVFNPQWTCVLQ